MLKILTNTSYYYHKLKVVLEGAIPRLVFGNDAGWSNNITSNKNLRQLRKTFISEVDTSDEINFLNQEGYLLKKSSISKDRLDKIASTFDELISDPKHSFGPSDDSYRHLLNPLKSIPQFKELITEDVIKILYGYYRCSFKIETVRSWRIKHVDNSNEDTYSNLWHIDKCPVNSLRLFVLLSESTTKESGATVFHGISSTKRIIRSGLFLDRSIILGKAKRMIEDEKSINYLEGERGDLGFLNVQKCLHRAGVPERGQIRDIVQFYISPADEEFDNEKWHLKLPFDDSLERLKISVQ